jgi:hypothetical protein
MIQLLSLIGAISSNMQNIEQAIALVEKLIVLAEAIKSGPQVPPSNPPANSSQA